MYVVVRMNFPIHYLVVNVCEERLDVLVQIPPVTSRERREAKRVQALG